MATPFLPGHPMRVPHVCSPDVFSCRSIATFAALAAGTHRWNACHRVLPLTKAGLPTHHSCCCQGPTHTENCPPHILGGFDKWLLWFDASLRSNLSLALRGEAGEAKGTNIDDN